MVDDFKARFPEFVTAQADQYVPIYEGVYGCYYGGVYDPDDACEKEIILNLIAHLITVEVNAGSGNVKSVASKSVGNVSVSYTPGAANQTETRAWFGATKYGARYLLLTRHRQGGVFV